jgi:hypothetical protein
MILVGMPNLARRIPARRPVGPAPEMRTGMDVEVEGDASPGGDESEKVVMVRIEERRRGV